MVGRVFNKPRFPLSISQTPKEDKSSSISLHSINPLYIYPHIMSSFAKMEKKMLVFEIEGGIIIIVDGNAYHL